MLDSPTSGNYQGAESEEMGGVCVHVGGGDGAARR